ncbi:hypothetical protein LZ554_004627 [Drepanopeziza brunnea f. sp. 'monogermtubi']|nr:hypothetical protein LZ554_004627 [Drepanopeziza brunnea f. sp. 'monogermtubi']
MSKRQEAAVLDGPEKLVWNRRKGSKDESTSANFTTSIIMPTHTRAPRTLTASSTKGAVARTSVSTGPTPSKRISEAKKSSLTATDPTTSVRRIKNPASSSAPGVTPHAPAVKSSDAPKHNPTPASAIVPDATSVPVSSKRARKSSPIALAPTSIRPRPSSPTSTPAAKIPSSTGSPSVSTAAAEKSSTPISKTTSSHAIKQESTAISHTKTSTLLTVISAKPISSSASAIGQALSAVASSLPTSSVPALEVGSGTSAGGPSGGKDLDGSITRDSSIDTPLGKGSTTTVIVGSVGISPAIAIFLGIIFLIRRLLRTRRTGYTADSPPSSPIFKPFGSPLPLSMGRSLSLRDGDGDLWGFSNGNTIAGSRIAPGRRLLPPPLSPLARLSMGHSSRDWQNQFPGFIRNPSTSIKDAKGKMKF